jgi:SAM-dependent methyltransferase
MSVEILLTKSQIEDARAELRRRSLHFVTPRRERALRKLHLLGGVSVGDLRKSWDVLKTAQFIEKNVPRGACILDIGACGSESLCIFSRLGYSKLVGIDLDSRILHMPRPSRHVIGDFMTLPFQKDTFEAVSAISAIEHGFHPEALLAELRRVIKPGGYFVASTDYWPDKVNTDGIKAYGMSWLIFSRAELMKFVEQAAEFGFSPVGTIHSDSREKTIDWMNREYTFAWLALQKASIA